MSKKTITDAIRAILGRLVPDGGFSEHPGSTYRADATSWAILALKATGAYPDVLGSARSRLASEQFADGRVCLVKDQFQTYWPTSLAILAWHGSSVQRPHQERAIKFLLASSGLHGRKSADAPYAHDPSIRGWSWTEDTFAWVEPTSMSVLSLCLSGFGAHERVNEAIKLLMDRQLPSGGWNYGNTVVYGQELHPQPKSTGMALSALAGHVEKKGIERSLDYLKMQAAACRTPLSLGWALFGLGAWGERPPEAARWLIDCLSRQKKFGTYGTALLSLVLLAYEAKGGFLETIS